MEDEQPFYLYLFKYLVNANNRVWSYLFCHLGPTFFKIKTLFNVAL
jgi:hypothetical protein